MRRHMSGGTPSRINNSKMEGSAAQSSELPLIMACTTGVCQHGATQAHVQGRTEREQPQSPIRPG
jgi:hypothetical protein